MLLKRSLFAHVSGNNCLSFSKLVRRIMVSNVSQRDISNSLPSLCNGLISHTQQRYFSGGKSDLDVLVIGGGPGGYVAAIKAAQLGLTSGCVEKDPTLGGTCLNVGCIPSKALLNISHKYHEAKHTFSGMGININGPPTIDIPTMMRKKEQNVKGLTQGIEFLFKKNKVKLFKGIATLAGPNSVKVKNEKGETQEITASNIILATGSEPRALPGNPDLIPDGKTLIDSTGALSLTQVPKKMLVIGGGVIGLELGSVWARLGAEVEVIEFLGNLCPALDSEISKTFQKVLMKQGMKFHMNTKVTGAEILDGTARIMTESVDGKQKNHFEADVVLLSVGRKPFTINLGLEQLGIQTDKEGRILIDDQFRVPNVHSIRAIGDVIHGPMLAHKAEEEGIACVELIAGKGSGHVNYNTVPNVIYTHPEVAGVGYTEEQLKDQGVNYSKGVFPFAANSRARTNDDADGMVKVLVDKSSDKLLGGWIIGPEAGELIAELVLALEYGAASEDIARTCHAHPTLSEAVKEACMAAYDKPIHFG